MPFDPIFLVIGCAIYLLGALSVYLFIVLRLKNRNALQQLALDNATQKLAQQTEKIMFYRQTLGDKDATIERLQHNVSYMTGRAEYYEKQQEKYQEMQDSLMTARIALEKTRVQQQELNAFWQEKEALLTTTKNTMLQNFKLLAQEIFQANSHDLNQQNKETLQLLLQPIKEEFNQLNHLINDKKQQDHKDRGLLNHELNRLSELNHGLHQEAIALSRALTGGNNKTQGIWGEMILAKVLEHSGLRLDHEYRLQVPASRQHDDHHTQRYFLDAVIDLPDQRTIIIDAKVSLLDYLNYVNSDDPQQQKTALNAHCHSLRQHVKSLASKNYHDVLPGTSLDFVLMFIPIEPAYLAALSHDKNFLTDAFAQHIFPVGPSNLLASLRIIHMTWQTQHQNEYAQAIALAGGRLFDKFVTLSQTLEKIGNNLATTQKSWQEAMTQLKEGRGNLINQAQNLRNMGVKANKNLTLKSTNQDNTAND